MTKNQVHEWHETLHGGAKRYYRGYWDSRSWRFSILDKEVRAWVPVEKPDLELWEKLHDVLFRKYQRRRLHYKLLDSVEKVIKELREEMGLPPEDETAAKAKSRLGNLEDADEDK